MLTGSSAQSAKEGWYLCDGGAALPLPTRYENGWHIRAVCDGSDACLFGLWNGERFMPESLWNGSGWLELRTLRGVK